MSHPPIPTPHYTLIETSRGNDPAMVIVNSALRTFEQRDFFEWHLTITITCQFTYQNRLPTKEESGILNGLEDKSSAEILKEDNAVLLARITCRGFRELKYRIHNPETANAHLEKLITTECEREWDYLIEEDPSWKIAQPELSLLE